MSQFFAEKNLALPPALFMGRPNYLLFFFLCCFLMRPHFLFFYHSKNFETSLFLGRSAESRFLYRPLRVWSIGVWRWNPLTTFRFSNSSLTGTDSSFWTDDLFECSMQLSHRLLSLLLAIFIFYPPDWMDTFRKYIRHLVFLLPLLYCCH